MLVVGGGRGDSLEWRELWLELMDRMGGGGREEIGVGCGVLGRWAWLELMGRMGGCGREEIGVGCGVLGRWAWFEMGGV